MQNPEKDRGLKLDSHGNIMVNIYQTVSLVLRSTYLLFLELLNYIANTIVFYCMTMVSKLSA